MRGIDHHPALGFDAVRTCEHVLVEVGHPILARDVGVGRVVTICQSVVEVAEAYVWPFQHVELDLITLTLRLKMDTKLTSSRLSNPQNNILIR